jgi:hypothetical protein
MQLEENKNSDLMIHQSETCHLEIVSNIIPEWRLTVHTPEKPLLIITKDGEVIAPDIESANEAGKVFIDSIRHELERVFELKINKEKGNERIKG